MLLPSTTHRDDIPEADMPLRKRARFTAPTRRFMVGESSAAVAARQTGHTLAHRVDYGFIDTIDASIQGGDMVTSAFGHIHVLEARDRARPADLEDNDSKAVEMAMIAMIQAVAEEDSALTWWNSHVETIGHDASYRMTQKTLMKMPTDKYCPRGEIKKLEIEM
ncbi:hypothetical protein Tco_1120018 [Tanacetum coccineum]|uniref:Uncharacterized protein n=1 Tax=Tanacetum coccineum TaxID=301880 RepID=A0ABQ4ZHY0_9ASTR